MADEDAAMNATLAETAERLYGASEAPAEPVRTEVLKDTDRPTSYAEAEKQKIEKARQFEADIDADLRKAMTRIVEREKRVDERDPSMPALPAIEGEGTDEMISRTLREHTAWKALPLAARQDLAAATKTMEQYKEAAKQFGMEIKTPADVAAIQKLMAGDRAPEAQAAPAAPHKVWTEGLGLDGVKTDAEAIERFGQIVGYVREKGPQGWRELAEQYGVHPFQMLTEAELERAAQVYLAGATGQQMPQRAEDAALQMFVTEWAADKPMYAELRGEMAELLQQGKFANKTSMNAMLNAAYSEARRRDANRKLAARKNPKDLDAQISAAVEKTRQGMVR